MNYSDPFRALGLIMLIASTIITGLNVPRAETTEAVALITQFTATPPTPVTPTSLPNTPTIALPTEAPQATAAPTLKPIPSVQPTPTRKWADSEIPNHIFPMTIDEQRLVERRNVLIPSRPVDTGWHVGIISGHRGYDPGAVCEDDGTNLQEAEVVYAIAQETQAKLEDEGVTVDILDEFDGRLDDYEAHAVVSLHADMCHPDPILTGFKSAAAPDPQSKILQTCVNEQYERVTGLAQDASIYHITGAMTHYHAFRKVALETPIIILETGYLHHDRELLLDSERPAAAITEGFLCYLQLTATE